MYPFLFHFLSLVSYPGRIGFNCFCSEISGSMFLEMFDQVGVIFAVSNVVYVSV